MFASIDIPSIINNKDKFRQKKVQVPKCTPLKIKNIPLGVKVRQGKKKLL
jgi:hypothetical protein